MGEKEQIFKWSIVKYPTVLRQKAAIAALLAENQEEDMVENTEHVLLQYKAWL